MAPRPDQAHIEERNARLVDCYNRGSVDDILDFMNDDLDFSDFSLGRLHLNKAAARTFFEGLLAICADMHLSTRSIAGYKGFTTWEWNLSFKYLQSSAGTEGDIIAQMKHGEVVKMIGVTVIWWDNKDKVVTKHDYGKTVDNFEGLYTGNEREFSVAKRGFVFAQFPCTRCIRKNPTCITRVTQRGNNQPGSNSGKLLPIEKPSSAVRQARLNSDTVEDKLSRDVQDRNLLLDEMDMEFHPQSDGGTLLVGDGEHDDHLSNLFFENDMLSSPGGLDYHCRTNSTGHQIQNPKHSAHENLTLGSFMQGVSLETENLESLPGMVDLHNFDMRNSCGTTLSSVDEQTSPHMSYLHASISQTSMSFPTTSDASSHEDLPLEQCNPVVQSNLCSPTVRDHLRLLCSKCNLQQRWADGKFDLDQNVNIKSLHADTRDMLMVMMQKHIQRVQRAHYVEAKNDTQLLPTNSDSVYFMLPCYLQLCIYRLEFHYPFISAAHFETNQLTQNGKTAILSLEMLLMVAGGAMAASQKETCCHVSHGLIEVFRISLSNLIDQNIKLASDLIVLKCALLFVVMAT
ncbi:hypothetical protein G7Y89_g3217 [Cudoniella acicularis]|uniref:SnoaL-like domain-containing protein n=1 Tax=Cudoniella acicularis TaxID=354080 RepID=A0A8H4RTW0_9HELO|nr:hypothetical protein G7Y89_g3217 [Cudoniella acicularis]